MEKIFLMGANSQIKHDDLTDTKTLLGRCGGNTGNLLIGYSLLKQLVYKEISRDMQLHPEQINEDFDCFVIAASNFLNEHFKPLDNYLESMSQLIEQTDLPCVMVGVGSQSKNFHKNFKISEKALHFFKLVSERSVSIGVRGEYTAEILNKYGILNVEPLGCPSFYLSCVPEIQVHKKPFNEVKKIAINGSRNVVHQSFNPDQMRRIEKKLVNLALQYNSIFIAQSEYEEIVLSRENKNEVNNNVFDPIKSYYQLSENEPNYKEFLNFFKHNVKVFFDVKKWESEVKGYDFICGTRFHGSMIALQNGVPATVIIHDSRTREMCELLKIPHVFISDIEEDERENFIAKIYDLADFDSMCYNYSSLYKKYIKFLNKNRLKHRCQY